MRWRVANQALQFPGEIPIPADMARWSRGPHTNRLVAIAARSPTPSILTADHRPRAAQPAEIRTAPGQRSANLRYTLAVFPRLRPLDCQSRNCRCSIMLRGIDHWLNVYKRDTEKPAKDPLDIAKCPLMTQSGHANRNTKCLLLTRSGHERLKIAAVQTNPESHSRAMAASKVGSLALPKFHWSPTIQFSGELYAYLHTSSKIFSRCCGCGPCGNFFDRGARRGVTSDRGGSNR